MLEGRVAPRLSLRIEREGPARAVVAPFLRVETGEKTVGEAIIITDDPGGIGVLAHVLLLDTIMFEGIVDHAADESDVGARAQLGEYVGDRAGTVKAWIDMQDIGALLLGARQPIHRDGMIFRRISA